MTSGKAKFHWHPGDVQIVRPPSGTTRRGESITAQMAAEPHIGLASGYELNPRSGMISLDLPPGAITPVSNGVDDHHITVVYLGPDVDDEAFAEAQDRARQAASAMPGPLTGMVGGVGTFPPSAGSHGKVPAWAGVVLPGAERLRSSLEDLSASEHPDWKPHVTLTYVKPGEALPAPVPQTPVTFTHLSVHRGNNQVARFPLGGSPGMANTISGQLLELSAASRAKAHATASATARHHAEEHWHRDAHGRFASTGGGAEAKSLPWDADGDVMRYRGSLGIDRANMPQVSGTLADGRYASSSEMMPKFLDRLRDEGVSFTHERVPARSLKPTQTSGDMRAVRGIAGSLASGELKDTKPVLVSSDNRVIDGHHQWAAHVLGDSEGTRTGSEPGEPVIRAGLPAGELLEQARQFARDQGIQNRKTGVAANPAFQRPSSTAQAAPKDSLEAHTRPDGTLDPERAALHERIVNDILAGHQPQEHPVATFFGGGPAAGKSTALKATAPDTAVIDSDDIKARLPEYRQMVFEGDPKAASYVHEESSAISKQVMREAQKRRLNYVLDGTGDSSLEKMAGKVNDAKKHRYMTEGKYVTVGTDEAVRRAKARAEATGRHVPETFIRETHAAVSDTFAKAAKMGLFDRSELWDTSHHAPRMVAGKEPGQQFAVHDPIGWQAFLDKANEGKT